MARPKKIISEPMAPLVNRSYVKVGSPTGDKSFDALIEEIETLLKPYRHSMTIRIEKVCGTLGNIGIDATIFTTR